MKKTKWVITRNYFWSHCAQDAERYIKKCITFNRHKDNVNVRAQLEHYQAQLSLFQLVAMDYMDPLPMTMWGNRYILVFIDHFSKWHEIVPVRDISAIAVAEGVKSFIITCHSCPEVLLSDNVPEFTSELIQRLCAFYGIKKCEAHPYKPISNWAV